jgi:hypothetical protein
MATATAAHSAAESQATLRFTLTERELREYSARAIGVSAENHEGSERRAERSCVKVRFNGN